MIWLGSYLARLWNFIMADTPSKPLDLSFLGRDVRNQLEHSKNILHQVQMLQDLLPKIEDEEVKKKIQVAINELLGITTSMTMNAATTTSSATTSVSTVFFNIGKKT